MTVPPTVMYASYYAATENGVHQRPLFSFDRCQDGRTLVLNEHDQKLRRLRFASVATDNVNVVGTFIEGLTRLKGDRLRPL